MQYITYNNDFEDIDDDSNCNGCDLMIFILIGYCDQYHPSNIVEHDYIIVRYMLIGYCDQYHPSNIVEHDYIIVRYMLIGYCDQYHPSNIVEHDYIIVRYMFFVDVYSTPRTCTRTLSC